MGKKERLNELDMVKGWGILLVCFRHINEITGMSALQVPLFVWVYSLFEAYMVMFLLLSGYVYTPKGTILQDITKKAKRLLIPLFQVGLLSTAVYFLRYVLIEKKPLLWFVDNTVTNFLGLSNWNVRLGQALPNTMKCAFTPHWFVNELFVAFLVFLPLFRLTERKPVWTRILTAALLMGGAIVCNVFDVQHTLSDTYYSSVSFYFVLINIFGFSSVLMIGKLLSEVDLFRLEAHSNRFNTLCAILCFVGDTLVLLLYKDNGYSLQYGNWGPFGNLGIPVTALDGFMLTYVLVFLFHYGKRLTILKKPLRFLGENSLYILLLHLTIAETICWIGGFWQDVYHQPYGMENFSVFHWIITVAGTTTVLGGFFMVRAFRRHSPKGKAR